MKRLSIAVALVMALAGSASAEIQKSGPQVFPGKFQLGAHVMGGQFGFTGYEASGLRFDFDFAGRLKDYDKFGLWLGGGTHYTAGGGFYGPYGGFGHELGFWVFVEFSLEKLMTIPLVPYVRAGLEGGLVYFGGAGGFFDIRIQAGMHYWIVKNVGLGGELSTGLGFAGYPGHGNGAFRNGVFGFYGVVTAVLGARFAF